MQLGTRKLLDRAFAALGVVAILLVALALVAILGPIVVGGLKAFVFRHTVERRELMLEKFARGDRAAIEAETAEAREARQPIYDWIAEFERDLASGGILERLEKQEKYKTAIERLPELKEALRELLGPPPGEPRPVELSARTGATRWDRALARQEHVLYKTEYEFPDPDEFGVKVLVPRAEDFAGTPVAKVFPYVEEHLEEMLRPRWTFYWRFLFDKSYDSHAFGGVWPEMLGTLYLTVGAILFSVPMGVIAAIYLVEYSGEGRLVSVLRTFISTLAGVPSIVFGLFGLAFFINGIHVSDSKSVLAGSLTLGLLVLPMVIRASEEALRAVPQTYKEAALSLGASRWRTVLTVVLPAALPGILTGIVISMGRAAGETAPIIFTAAVIVGQPLGPAETLSQPTPALPWNIYYLCSEHAEVYEIRHVQYGMVLTLVGLVLLLNAVAIVLRARISRKLKG
ncbi:MAG: phosphate ABC transporter permease PstA [Candidatus Brocadiia bacterium]